MSPEDKDKTLEAAGAAIEGTINGSLVSVPVECPSCQHRNVIGLTLPPAGYKEADYPAFSLTCEKCESKVGVKAIVVVEITFGLVSGVKGKKPVEATFKP